MEDKYNGFDNPKEIKIAVMGLGGAGNNALNHMIGAKGFEKVDFYAANTDAQALNRSSCNKIALGKKLTQGFGSGGDPKVGREATLENSEELQNIIRNYDTLVLIAGAGGGTGSGALEVISDIAKNLNVLTLCAITRPFKIEGLLRNRIAIQAIDNTRQIADLSIILANDNLKKSLDENVTLIEAFKASNEVIANTVRSIVSLINASGLINVDYNDICSVTRGMGLGIISVARAKGDLRAKTAVIAAVNNTLMDSVDISDAKAALVNVTSGLDFKLSEYEVIGEMICSYMSDSAKLIMGSVIDPDMKDGEIQVNLILTGIESQSVIPTTPSSTPNSLSRDKGAFRNV